MQLIMYEQKAERGNWIHVSIDSETKDEELKEEEWGREDVSASPGYVHKY